MLLCATDANDHAQPFAVRKVYIWPLLHVCAIVLGAIAEMVEINTRCFSLLSNAYGTVLQELQHELSYINKAFSLFPFLSYHEEKLKPTVFYDSEPALSHQLLQPREKTLQQ